MAIFPTITQQELESVGVVGLPDRSEEHTSELQSPYGYPQHDRPGHAGKI